MRALILGVSGQDGFYLAEQLVADGYDVWGMVRRNNASVAVPVVTGDLLDQDSLERALTQVKPDEVYNLAAVTAPGMAWGTPQPPLLADVTALGVVRLLDAILKAAPDAHLVHASSSAVFDPDRYGLYGAAKVFAHQAVQGYRSRLRCSNAVLFSHTSPRQDPRFLARRICTAVTRAASGSGDRLVLGDVESRRDWGYAPDYCEAMRLIGKHDQASDWVVAGGRSRTVRELAETALDYVGLHWDDVVTLDHSLPRVPHEPSNQDGRLVTERELGWTARTTFTEMVEICVRAAMADAGSHER